MQDYAEEEAFHHYAHFPISGLLEKDRLGGSQIPLWLQKSDLQRTDCLSNVHSSISWAAQCMAALSHLFGFLLPTSDEEHRVA